MKIPFNIEKPELKIGFIPLTDCAPLVVAKEMGFFKKWGLNVKLEKQHSWATLRDKVHAGLLDACHDTLDQFFLEKELFFGKLSVELLCSHIGDQFL